MQLYGFIVKPQCDKEGWPHDFHPKHPTFGNCCGNSEPKENPETLQAISQDLTVDCQASCHIPLEINVTCPLHIVVAGTNSAEQAHGQLLFNLPLAACPSCLDVSGSIPLVVAPDMHAQLTNLDYAAARNMSNKGSYYHRILCCEGFNWDILPGNVNAEKCPSIYNALTTSLGCRSSRASRFLRGSFCACNHMDSFQCGSHFCCLYSGILNSITSYSH